jgi:hypothetical protein
MMKRRIIAVLLVVALTACAEAQTEETPAPEAAEIPVEIPSEPEEFIEHDFSALEYLIYRIDEDGFVYIDISQKNNCNPDLFREFFFGVWDGWFLEDDGFLILDDSEKSHLAKSYWSWLFDSFYLYNETLVITCVSSIDTLIFWLNINEPDVLYVQGGYSNSNGEIKAFNINNDSSIIYTTQVLTKTNIPINEAEDNFLSRLKLFELKMEYDIEHLFRETDYFLDDYYFILYNQPTYLLSATSNELLLKTRLVFGYGSAFLDVIYEIKNIDGEWIHTRIITPEAIENARKQLEERTY